MNMLPVMFAKLSTLFFAAPGDACKPAVHTFFIFQSWWKYLGGKYDVLNKCMPTFENFKNNKWTFDINNVWLVGLALLDDLLRLAGFLAVISIMVAGIELVRSEGSSEKATNARQRLINSLVGLAIAAGATALVTFVGNVVGGNGNGLPHTIADQDAINRTLNAVFVIIGALAVLYIVLAGFRMVTSGDNPTKVAESRRQILFAVLGLVVIATADAIVNLVLGKLNG
jgi:type IV secretory pathway VirB2 component (pilin)